MRQRNAGSSSSRFLLLVEDATRLHTVTGPQKRSSLDSLSVAGESFETHPRLPRGGAARLPWFGDGGLFSWGFFPNTGNTNPRFPPPSPVVRALFFPTSPLPILFCL